MAKDKIYRYFLFAIEKKVDEKNAMRQFEVCWSHLNSKRTENKGKINEIKFILHLKSNQIVPRKS